MSKPEPPFDHTISDFKPGNRVELHPACDRWMMGDRFGTVTSVSSSRVYVKLDKSRKRFAFEPDLLRFYQMSDKKTCFACKYSYMEPDAPDLVCGHKDSGGFGLYVKGRPVDHCGDHMKFEQHPLRNPNGSLKTVT